MSKRINNYNTVSTSPSIQISNTNTIGNLFTTGGNVGINTIAPDFTLDVSGITRITNSLTTGSLFSSNLTTSNAVFTNVTIGSFVNTNGFTSGNIRLNNNSIYLRG